ncbi:MAG: hypothetical protein CEN87_1 [Parcubacteria group bacterium Licking1014_1]|nr:MAG: hypothetical protein CEN87_1 [Parcubacteria group bacterium Licking1014_1]
MKKNLLIFFASSIILFSFLSQVQAKPCGGEAEKGLVPCGQDTSCPCEISDFFLMFAKIFDFLVKMIAAPLAILMLTIGGVMILISAGNPNLAGMGKKILWASIIGLVLVFCSWLIIDFILKAMGYVGNWWEL